jgi:hypothetical protein
LNAAGGAGGGLKGEAAGRVIILLRYRPGRYILVVAFAGMRLTLPSPGIDESTHCSRPVRVGLTEVEMDGLLRRAPASRTIRTRAQFSSNPILFLHRPWF